MKFTHEHLLKKGWNREEAERAVRSFEHAESVKHPALKLLDRAIYWILLLLALAGNIIFSVFLVPFILLIDHPAIYALAFILGLSFGSLFSVVIRDMDHLRMGHHVLTIFIVPITAFIIFFLVVEAMSKMSQSLSLASQQNISLVSFVYVVGFLIPYTNFLLMHSLAHKRSNA